MAYPWNGIWRSHQKQCQRGEKVYTDIIYYKVKKQITGAHVRYGFFLKNEYTENKENMSAYKLPNSNYF